MANVLITDIDPVEGLVNYTDFVKPYHTKILEVLVEYLHVDCIDVTITEDFNLSLGIPDTDLLELWGWTEEQAKKFFNCDFTSFQVIDVDTDSNYWEVVGDVSSYITVGDVLLYQNDLLSFTEYTVTGVTVVTNVITTTQIEVSEIIPLGSKSDGVLHPYKSSFTDSNGNIVPTACWTSVPGATNIYMRNVGIEWPSTIHVDKNIDCGGYGYIFQQAPESGSPPLFNNGLSTSNNIVGVNTSLRYFEIQNRVGVPSVIGTWADAYVYGAKFIVSGSTGNDHTDYTVLHSQAVSGSPELLRIFVIEGVTSSIVDGTLYLRPWGYDEPRVCINQGQSLQADAHIAETMSMTINDINTNFVQGWDMSYFDMDGYDGGPFTYLLTYT